LIFLRRQKAATSASAGIPARPEDASSFDGFVVQAEEGLPGMQKLWSLLALSLTTYAALATRRAGIKAQALLFAHWGGAPTTSRLRYRDNPNAGEVSRRHREVERALGVSLCLPDQSQEQADPLAADVEYDAAMRRIMGKVRDYPSARLVRMENRNYGYARNLYGLKRYGIICAVVVLVLCLCSSIVLSWLGDWRDALPLILPTVVSIFAVTAGPESMRTLSSHLPTPMPTGWWMYWTIFLPPREDITRTGSGSQARAGHTCPAATDMRSRDSLAVAF
jgi:hypothetical protein